MATTRQSSAKSAAAPKRPLGKVLVIGGCGFLGHHIVELLQRSYNASVSVIDLRTSSNRKDGVTYVDGDITKLESLLPVFEQIRPDVVIHTASPTLAGGSRELYYKVNVEGTKCVIEACQKTGVKALVYTSSASVVSDNSSDLINADERWPVIRGKKQTEYYSETKAQAEALAIAANRSATAPKLLTAAIRPATIFGPGDVQLIPNMLNVYYEGKTGFQLGENTNLFDFTYVENVAHGHLLAALALLATTTLATPPLDHEKVDGEVFFVTNDSPVYFWDFARALWAAAGSDKGTEHVWVIGQDNGLMLASAMEWVYWALRRTPKLTRRQVRYSSMTRYYDITKAKQRLGYEPIVPLADGIERSVKWFQELRLQEGQKKSQ
ncbi:3-beta hydroxysteroid dehydrogenase/isomerase [Phlyctema vagabunda]|uniref:3-beta hydroxysteroid dehydrogenase/isomerase n=1 Tax=Phlyctema vagabunda TaxID=108571 RepID=A0ABR4P3G3_9HELO